MSRRLHAPPMWRPRPIQPSKPTKVLLIHNGDLFALANRMDPNVAFWGPDAIDDQSVIPPYITDVWISERCPFRTRFVTQAIKGDVAIWKDEPDDLEAKLLPIWGFPGNLQPLNSAGQTSSVEAIIERLPSEFFANDEESGTGPKIDSLLGYSGLPEHTVGVTDRDANEDMAETRQNDKAKQRRLQLIKRIGAKWSAGKSTASPKPQSAKVSKAMTTTLSMLPEFDRKVYVRYMELADKNGNRLAIIASEVNLPAPNVERIIKRVEARLATKG